MSENNDSSDNPFDWSWEKIDNYLGIFDHISVGYHDNFPRKPFSGHGTPVLKVIDISPTKSADGKLTLNILASSNWFDNDIHRIFSDTQITEYINSVGISKKHKQELMDKFKIGHPALEEPFISSSKQTKD